MRRFEGKTVMITGCNRGIGKAMLEAFAREGANIVACTRRQSTGLNDYYFAVSEMYGVSIYPYHFDLSSDEDIKSVMRIIVNTHKKIDCLVNNAAMPAGGLMVMTGISQLKEVFQVNYFSQVLISQYVIKNMIKSRKGSVIFMTSVMGLDSMAGGTAYGASKAAIAMLVKTLSKEVGRYGIRINGIAPNLVETEMAAKMEQKSFEDMISRSALGRIGQPAEIADTALFLASDEASYITGQIIRVDGGL